MKEIDADMGVFVGVGKIFPLKKYLNEDYKI